LLSVADEAMAEEDPKTGYIDQGRAFFLQLMEVFRCHVPG
jgi:hypothetical protein